MIDVRSAGWGLKIWEQVGRGLVAIAIPALFLGPGCGRDDRPPNILLISVDTLRLDHLSYTGYERRTSPRIDELAGDSVRFDNAFATRGQTWPSLTSVMTGMHPIAHGVRRNGDMLGEEIPTLAEVLLEHGYETGSFLTNYCNAPNRGFETKKYFWNTSLPHSLWDRQMTDAAIDWLQKRSGDRPFFGWLHLMSPHADFDPPEPYRSRFAERGVRRLAGTKSVIDRVILGELEASPEDLEHIIALYDGEIAYTDFLVGRVLDELEALDQLDRTVVVFFSDHGEELMDHQGYMYHTCSLFDAVLRVPLLIRLPEAERGGTRVSGLVSLVDLLPTLLGVAKVARPAHLPEVDLLVEPSEGGAGAESVLAEWAGVGPTLVEDPAVEVQGRRSPRIYALRTGRFKYIYNPGSFRPREHPYQLRPQGGFHYATEELYDTARDPGETRNVIRDHPDVAALLRERVVEWIGEERPLVARSTEPDPATKAALRSLGYIVGEDEDDRESDPAGDDVSSESEAREEGDGN